MAPSTRSTRSIEREPNNPRNAEDSQTTVAETPSAPDPIREEGPVELQPSPDPQDTSDPPGSTGPSHSQSFQQLITERVATEKRIRELRALQDLRDQEQALLRQLGLRTPPNPQGNPIEPQSYKNDIKFDDIPKLDFNTSLQKHREWLYDLELMFTGAPSKYYDDSRKIIGALMHVKPDVRKRWRGHVAERAHKDGRDLNKEWAYFEEWTRSTLLSALNLDGRLANERETIRQRDDEDPRDFHVRLDAVERFFDRDSDTRRATDFYGKLLPWLQSEIQRFSNGNLPKTRDEMVNTASRHYTLSREDAKHHRTLASSQANNSRKRKAPDGDTITNPPASRDTRTSNRGRGNRGDRGRNRGGRFARNIKNNNTNIDSAADSDLNPIGQDGKRNICFNCGSDRHYSTTCPHPQKDEKAKIQELYAENDSEAE